MLKHNKTIFESFLQYLQYEKQYSSDTIRSYKSDLLQFFNFIDKEIPIEKIVTNDIQEFLQQLGFQKMTERTMARKLATIKSFYKYLVHEGKVPLNCAKLIRAPRIPKRLPNYLSEIEIIKLLDYPYGVNYSSFRDQLILELFYATGIRISELAKIKLIDIKLEGKTIRLLGKGNRERIAVFGNTFQSILKDYLDKRNELDKFTLSPYLFPQLKKKKDGSFSSHISIKTVYNIVKKYIRAISSNEKLSPHSIRHSFASHLLNNGADLMSVKDLLGHVSLSSTQIYTHVNIKKIQETFKQAHPHGK